MLKSDIIDVLESNAPILASTIDQSNTDEVSETDQTSAVYSEAAVDTAIYTAGAGDVKSITEAPDDVFSQKMMGDGFIVDPSSDEIVSPVSGTIENIFPTKHAISIKTAEGIDVLVHMGIDTVELEGRAFTVHVKEGQAVQAGDALADMDRKQVIDAGKNTLVMVVFTNLSDKQIFKLHAHPDQSGRVGTIN